MSVLAKKGNSRSVEIAVFLVLIFKIKEQREIKNLNNNKSVAKIRLFEAQKVPNFRTYMHIFNFESRHQDESYYR